MKPDTPAALQAYTIHGVNRLPEPEKRAAYLKIVPPELFARFGLDPARLAAGEDGRLQLSAPAETSSAEMALYHQAGSPDPVLYGHITDTITGHVHVLLYVLNDPASPRFDIDRLPDGTPTSFGTAARNREAERAALEFGLAPGQVRRGLRLLGEAVPTFEGFVASLGQEMYFIEPLYYHNAVIFERYGFAYQQGRRRMERYHAGFAPGGDLRAKLDGSTPFRRPEAANSIRLRSWAIHDGILGEPFTEVTMYKRIGRNSGVDTCPGCEW